MEGGGVCPWKGAEVSTPRRGKNGLNRFSLVGGGKEGKVALSNVGNWFRPRILLGLKEGRTKANVKAARRKNASGYSSGPSIIQEDRRKRGENVLREKSMTKDIVTEF